MKDCNFEKITKQLKSNLSDKRYQHCERVLNNAQIVAKCFSYDVEKAKIAGLLHDYAKELSNEEMISVCIKHGLPLGDKDSFIKTTKKLLLSNHQYIYHILYSDFHL